MPVYYDNQSLEIPGAYTFVNPSGLTVGGLGNEGLVLLVGSSVGGAPGQVLSYSDPSSAARGLRGGDLLNAYNFATKKGGAQNIACWRTDPATQASLTLFGSNNAPSMTLTSVDSGAYTNQFSLSLTGQAGNQTATFVDGYSNRTFTQAGLGSAFAVQYTGNATSAQASFSYGLTSPAVTLAAAATGTLATGTYTVVVDAKNAASLALTTGTIITLTGTQNAITTTWGGVSGAFLYDVYLSGTQGYSYVATTPATTSGTVSYTILNSGTPTSLPTAQTGAAFVALLSGQTDGSQSLNFPVTTVGSLVSLLNVQQGYTAASTSTVASQIPGPLLDPAGPISLLGTTGAAFTAQTGAIATYLQSLGYVTVAIPGGSLNPPAAMGQTNMVGGANGSQTASQWGAVADALATMNPLPRYIVALSDVNELISPLATAVITLDQAFPAMLSELFIGGSTTPTPTTAIQQGAQFASHRIVNNGMSFWDYDYNLTYTLFPSYMLGAIYAGLRASIGAPDALTNQLLNVQALGYVPTPTQLALLLENNVATPMINSLGQIVIARGVTTSSDHTNLYHREESIVNAADTLRLYVIHETAQARQGNSGGLIGQANYGATTVTGQLGYLNGLLQNAQNKGWIAGFTRITNLAAISNNPEYELVTIQVTVPVPNNGMVFALDLAIPVGL